MVVNTKRNPMQTRNGRVKLGPLNVSQLTAMLENASIRNKQKMKIRNRIQFLKTIPGYIEPVVEVSEI
jgi:hypothetical protein